ncbi:hypothetical protein ACA910_006794 [Epithemia clementina (nom. ined.)]
MVRLGDWKIIGILSSTWDACYNHPFWREILRHLHPVLQICPSIGAALESHTFHLFMLNGNTHLLEYKLLALPATAPVVLLTDTLRDRFVWKDIRWRRITHHQVGGITTRQALFGHRHIRDLTWLLTIRRTVGHILNYNKAVKPLFSGGTLPGPHYTETSALRAQYLDTPVVHPTFWSCTGFGFWELAPREIGAAFNLPSWISPRGLEQWLQDLHHAPDAFVPLKLGSQFLHEVVLQLEPAATLNLSLVVVRKWPLPTAAPTVSFTVFPDLHQNLSSSWIDQTLVSDNTAKDDDATAPSQLGDNRLIGLFPGLCEVGVVHEHHLKFFVSGHLVVGVATCICQHGHT